MNQTLPDLSSSQLRQAASLKARIESLQQELAGILGRSASAGSPSRRRMSPAAIAKIRAAAKKRWAGKGGGSRRKMSAATKAKLAAIARARWKKTKAAGKNAL